MGFSIAGSPSISTIMAEIALANTSEGCEAEGLNLPQEFIDPEMGEEIPQGALRGDTKEYIFVRQQSAALAQKLSDFLSDIQAPKLKNLDLKESVHHLSFKETQIKEKEFKVLKSHQQQATQEQSTEGKDTKTFTKINSTAQGALKEGVAPKSLAQLKQTPALKQQQDAAKTLERQVHSELIKGNESRQKIDQNRKDTEPRKQAKESERESWHTSTMQRLDKNEERDGQQHKRQKKDEEEGFADGQRDQKHQNEQDHEDKGEKVSRIHNRFAVELGNYGAEESILSEIYKMRISQFDVLILFIEIMKLEIKGREQERIARRHERELQLIHMQKIVENYKSQGQWLMFSSLGSGILAIVSGICPIIGHMKGDWILQKLGGVFSSLRDMKKDQFFKGVTKITFAMSEMYKSTGQIHNTFAEGNRTFDQHMSDLHRTDWDENTRTMEEIKDNWKGIENFLYQSLQMYHDAIRQLYS